MERANVFKDIQMPDWRWHLRSWEDVQASTLFTKINWVNILLLVVFLGLAVRQARSKMNAAGKAGHEKRFLKNDAFPQPTELPDFDYSTTQPEQIRRFKPKYHLTMSIENLDPNDLLLMDNTYAERIKYRAKIMREHTTNVVNVHDDKRIAPAVREYYSFMLGTYLPLRFPKMFKLHETEYETGKAFMLENKVSGALFQANPTKSVPTKQLLETLGRTIDEDVLFLLPEEPPSSSDDEKEKKDAKYVLQAYVCCCPSGFAPSEKLGLRLASIHGPVPGYADKLEGSMDRFFTKLEVGKYVKRYNWTVTVDTDLYAGGAKTNHLKEGEKVREMTDSEFEGLIDETYLRCERQTLHRLPESKAVVFSFKTYRYAIKDVKEEGVGEELAEAIEGMTGGNVPEMYAYKRGVVWGEAVKRYLRS